MVTMLYGCHGHDSILTYTTCKDSKHLEWTGHLDSGHKMLGLDTSQWSQNAYGTYVLVLTCKVDRICTKHCHGGSHARTETVNNTGHTRLTGPQGEPRWSHTTMSHHTERHVRLHICTDGVWENFTMATHSGRLLDGETDCSYETVLELRVSRQLSTQRMAYKTPLREESVWGEYVRGVHINIVIDCWFDWWECCLL